MEASSQKRLALDSNVLFDLAEDRDFAHDFREAYQSKGYALLIPPTVVAELYFFLEHGAPDEEGVARIAIQRLAPWDIQAVALTARQRRDAGALAQKFLRAGLLPPDKENDALILAEVSIASIPLVVTSDSHLLDVEPERVRTICLDAGSSPVFAASPRRLLRAIF